MLIEFTRYNAIPIYEIAEALIKGVGIPLNSYRPMSKVGETDNKACRDTLRLMKRYSLVFASFLLFGLKTYAEASNGDLTETQRQSISVTTPDQVSYIPLNPARGDRSPRAGVLWGDIRANTHSGVLLQFSDGFSSPPHIHNITYRAIVISGEMHNDDPEAERLWMGPGSFWTQPAGEIHITAANSGSGATAFLEILTGPYLVLLPGDAFDNGERPFNLLGSSLVWMGIDDFKWIGKAPRIGGGPQVALLWGDLGVGMPSGFFIKLPAHYTGHVYTIDGDLKSVVIQGTVVHQVSTVTDKVPLGPGGFFASAERVSHAVSCQAGTECVMYFRTEGAFALE